LAETIGELLVKVGLDNTGFNQGMKELDQSLKLARAEFQAAAAKMGDMGSAADQLKLKVEYLNKRCGNRQGHSLTGTGDAAARCF
jgi:phage-related minor tail protein